MEKENSILNGSLSFPLYACSKEVIKRYKKRLDKLDLTYTQYLTMQVLWERGNINVKELGLYLYLDSGTLTPLLKKLENKKYIKRDRSSKDERNLVISLTEKGKELKKETSHITEEVESSIKGLTKEDKKVLNNLLNKMTIEFNKDEE